MLSENNKLKRMEFDNMCLDKKDDFDNMIWSDESSMQLKRHSRTLRVKVGNERVFQSAAKHALKVHIWAGILKVGATNICILHF